MSDRKTNADEFSSKVLRWFDEHGRKDLPWQQNTTPYRVWVSEIMLQQTQVQTVIDYFKRFMERFPDIASLASADSDQVLHMWTGLGYYARARNLHKTARQVVSQYGGNFPQNIEELESLPGIGRSTAGAIAALSMNVRAAILDGNVKRVLTRFHGIQGWPEQSATRARLWELAESLTPESRVANYTQAMMDLGATVCTRSKPLCDVCPLTTECIARNESRQSQIPGKKPKKAIPTRTTRMFILRNADGEVLLEKRPPTGIWGGLHSLPESEGAHAEAKSDSDNQSIHTLLRIEASSCTDLPTLRHTFSHYHLDITPVEVAEWEFESKVADSDKWLWYPLDQTVEVGLAAPVKKLLDKLSQNSGDPTP